MVEAKARAIGLDALFTNISIGYVVLYLIVLALVMWRANGGSTKAIWAMFVTAVFAVPVGFITLLTSQSDTRAAVKNAEYMAKYEPAKAIFDKLCAEQSQPIIKRTVEDVEGVLLLKVRPSTRANYHQLIADPLWPGAAFEHERHEDSGYAEYFLLDRLWRSGDNREAPGMRASIGRAGIHGFRYVDIAQPDKPTRVRITAKEDTGYRELPMPGIRFSKVETSAPPPRYAITFEDNVDPELRKHWIAGTTVKVLDMQTNEVIGQRSFWKWDQGFGNRGGGRSPWGTAKSCPPNAVGRVRTHEFVDLVLKAKQGN